MPCSSKSAACVTVKGDSSFGVGLSVNTLTTLTEEPVLEFCRRAILEKFSNPKGSGQGASGGPESGGTIE